MCVWVLTDRSDIVQELPSFMSSSEKAHVSDLLWLGFAFIERRTRLLVHQAIAALDQFFQPLGEARAGAPSIIL